MLTVAAVFACPAAADEAAVARGAYLAAAAGCDGCHTDTKNGGPPYGGGRALATAFGTIAAPNITPDETGLGGWSLADFIRAMRWGIAPDGTHYVTAFPFPYFSGLKDADLADLKAYLDSLTPVVQADTGRAASLALLSRVRDAIGVALAPTAASLPYRAANPDTDPVVARGAYLVATVGRCGDCHTPRTLFGTPDSSRELAGSRGGLEGTGAPNITPDPKTGIGSWSEDDIVYLLKQGGTPDGDFVGGSMVEIVRNAARLTDDDRRAIAAYLKVLPAKVFDKNK